MKEIPVENKIGNIMKEVIVPIDRMNEQRRASAIANLVIKRTDEALERFRADLMADIYHEVLSELRSK